MAMNIEQRLEQSAKSIEQSSQKAHDFAEKDTTIQTCAGSRDSLPKVSRIWQENFARQLNKHATEFQDRFALSQQSLPWQAGITISDSLQRYHVGVQGEEGYKEFLPNPIKLPFETAATLAEDLTQQRWLENGVPNKHWTEIKVASALEKSLGVNARIWPKDRDLQVGDVIPSAQETADGLPITHVIVDGNAYATSRLVSGLVTDLESGGAIGGEISATIGGTKVVFQALFKFAWQAGETSVKNRIYTYQPSAEGGYLSPEVDVYDPVGGNLMSDNPLTDNNFLPVSLFARSSWYGASDVDSSDEINTALSNIKRLQIDRLTSCKRVSPRSGTIIDVSEVLQLPNDSDDGDTIITGNNVDRVIITGQGRILGNKSQQSGAKQQRLIRLLTNDSAIANLEVGENYSLETPTSSVYCVSMEGSRNRAEALRLSSWSQEGLVLKNSEYSMVSGVIANDADSKSWSAVQVHGSHNLINSVITKNTGASSVGCDSPHSVVTNIIADATRWYNGVNFGHDGSPANYSVASNLAISNLKDVQNPNAAGLSLANGTRLMSVVNYSLKNPSDQKANKGVNVSNGGGEHQILNMVLDGAITAVNLYASEYMGIGNMILKNCTYGIVKNDNAVLQLMNADLSGAETPMSGSGSSINVRAVNTLFDRNAPWSGGILLNNVSFPHRVSTKNMREFSSLIIEPSNAGGARAQVFVSSRGNGFFEINVAGSVEGGAHIRWRIV
ncbi:hypothetical protein VCSRO2_2131 [Vibrio cholerae]|nr:hypothetical protein [Vibrio cholerae]GHW98460.1 hypothetical protein VCSRO2_2131 [Vibrio cholerae]